MKVPRICELSDPDHPDYSPAYHEMVAGPTFWHRIKNASKAVVKLIASKGAMVDEETRNMRLAKCAACKPYFDAGWCSHEDCGCNLALKTRIASQSCPIGEWDAVEGIQKECEGCR